MPQHEHNGQRTREMTEHHVPYLDKPQAQTQLLSLAMPDDAADPDLMAHNNHPSMQSAIRGLHTCQRTGADFWFGIRRRPHKDHSGGKSYRILECYWWYAVTSNRMLPL